MRKPHFGPVDGAIASAFDDGQEIVVFRVEDDALGGGLRRQLLGLVLVCVPRTSAISGRTLRASSAADIVPRRLEMSCSVEPQSVGALSTRGRVNCGFYLIGGPGRIVGRDRRLGAG